MLENMFRRDLIYRKWRFC